LRFVWSLEIDCWDLFGYWKLVFDYYLLSITMANHTLKSIFNFFFKRAILLYGLIFIVLYVVVDSNMINLGIKSKMLGRLKPTSFSYFNDVSENNVQADPIKIEPYAKLFIKTVQLFPERADGYTLLGVSHYYLGNQERAVTSFLKAKELDPKFFWNYYNIGFIYFKNKNFQKAAYYLKLAIDCDPEYAHKALFTSSLYNQTVFTSVNNLEDYLAINVRMGFIDAYAMLGFCLKGMGKIKESDDILIFAAKSRKELHKDMIAVNDPRSGKFLMKRMSVKGF